MQAYRKEGNKRNVMDFSSETIVEGGEAEKKGLLIILYTSKSGVCFNASIFLIVYYCAVHMCSFSEFMRRIHHH